MIYGLYHSAGETVGLLGDVLHELSLPFRDVHLYEGDGLPRDTSDLEGLIIMGGPMNVDDIDNYPFLADEVLLIEKVLAENKPVLGICLGAQLMAKALGAKVYPNTVKELGWGPIQLSEEGQKDPLFAGVGKELTVVHWHGDTFDLPKGAVHLAQSKKCKNQAFRWGKNAYGLQFHLEVTPGMLKSWCASKDGCAELAAAGENADDIIKKTPAGYKTLEPVARKIFSTYLKASFGKLLSV